jgi:hypothetical protein
VVSFILIFLLLGLIRKMAGMSFGEISFISNENIKSV